MVPFDLLTKICDNLRIGIISRNEIIDLTVDSGLYQHLVHDLQQFRYYTFDGRFDNLLIESIFDRIVKNKSTFTSYDEFLGILSSKMQKLIVPTIILLPLVLVNGLAESSKETRIDFPNNKYVIFPLVGKGKPFKNERRALNQHVERTIFAKLLDEHILSVKDRHFFNYPILSIEIKDLDFRVEREAPKIIEAIYSFFRMIGFGNSTINEWIRPSEWRHFPSTYSVYYNEVGTSPNPPYDSGYGYSFRFMFTQLLDIDFQVFLKRKDLFSVNLDRFIFASFLSSKDTQEDIFTRYKKWQNAVLLFNEAYEFASKERFDSSLLLLMAILESLFLKNEGGNKKEQLISAIKEYFGDSVTEPLLFETIRSLYKKRNAFIHEGKKMTGYQIYKTLHDYGGLIPGMEPLPFCNSLSDDHDLKHLSILFMLCRDILLNYIEDK